MVRGKVQGQGETAAQESRGLQTCRATAERGGGREGQPGEEVTLPTVAAVSFPVNILK